MSFRAGRCRGRLCLLSRKRPGNVPGAVCPRRQPGGRSPSRASRPDRDRPARRDLQWLRSCERVFPLAGRGREILCGSRPSSTKFSRRVTTGEPAAQGHSTPGLRCCRGSGRGVPSSAGCRLTKRRPPRKALLATPAWRLDSAAHTAERLSDCPLSLNGIAKGFIVERACDAALEKSAGVSGILLNVGGDLRVRGDAARTIGIAAPWADSESSEPFVHDRSERPLGRHQRQIPPRVPDQRQVVLSCFRPKIGAAGRASESRVTVVAERGADADALAKICGVLEPEESLRLVNSLAGSRMPDLHGRRPGRQERRLAPPRTAAADTDSRWLARAGAASRLESADSDKRRPTGKS